MPPDTNAPTLAELQAAFQRALIADDDAVLAHVTGNSRTGRGTLLGVYRHAYLSRLTEVLGNDQPRLRAWFGPERFAAMARAYVAAHPSDTANVRWFSRHLPRFLGRTEPWMDYPAFAELAALELAMSEVFDAAEAPILRLAALQGVAPEDWPALVLTPIAATRRLDLTTNAADIWRALSEGQEPPAAKLVSGPPPDRPGPSPGAVARGLTPILVWRQGATPYFRALPPEEAMMWDEAEKGVRFGVLCELLATYDDPDHAAERAAGYLQGWLAGEVLSAAGSKEGAGR